MADRRSFLGGLAALPLIGGGVRLIGAPTAAAVPVTGALLETYDEWLDLERSALQWERYGAGIGVAPDAAPIEVVWRDRRSGECWTMRRATIFSGFDHRGASARAAVVLAAAGVDVADPAPRLQRPA